MRELARKRQSKRGEECTVSVLRVSFCCSHSRSAASGGFRGRALRPDGQISAKNTSSCSPTVTKDEKQRRRRQKSRKSVERLISVHGGLGLRRFAIRTRSEDPTAFLSNPSPFVARTAASVGN
jgi:allophanate hydrolase subunit 2